MKKVIVTGATGFLGKRITEELIERGDEVTIFTRSSVHWAESIVAIKS